MKFENVGKHKKIAGLSVNEIACKQAGLQNAKTKRKERSAEEHFQAFLTSEGEENVNIYGFEARLDVFFTPTFDQSSKFITYTTIQLK